MASPGRRWEPCSVVRWASLKEEVISKALHRVWSVRHPVGWLLPSFLPSFNILHGVSGLLVKLGHLFSLEFSLQPPLSTSQSGLMNRKNSQPPNERRWLSKVFWNKHHGL